MARVNAEFMTIVSGVPKVAVPVRRQAPTVSELRQRNAPIVAPLRMNVVAEALMSALGVWTRMVMVSAICHLTNRRVKSAPIAIANQSHLFRLPRAQERVQRATISAIGTTSAVFLNTTTTTRTTYPIPIRTTLAIATDMVMVTGMVMDTVMTATMEALMTKTTNTMMTSLTTRNDQAAHRPIA